MFHHTQALATTFLTSGECSDAPQSFIEVFDHRSRTISLGCYFRRESPNGAMFEQPRFIRESGPLLLYLIQNSMQ
jgi:hypothetical protein